MKRREQWRPIPEYEGLYYVSSLGRVFSAGRQGRKRSRMLRSRRMYKGYLQISLTGRGGQRKTYRVHRLVALTFLGSPNPGEEVRHLNGVRDDNRVANLAWGTGAENSQDAISHGTHPLACKTHCLRGHPFAGDNLHVDRRGRRVCRACRRLRDQSRPDRPRRPV